MIVVLNDKLVFFGRPEKIKNQVNEKNRVLNNISYKIRGKLFEQLEGNKKAY